MPESGVQLLDHKTILRYEEIFEFVRTAVQLGIDKVRLTGGEPLVRRGVVSLVEQIARLPGLRDLGLTTNGTMLPQFAKPLRAAGLNRINVSLDTLDAQRYTELTRGGHLQEVLDGLDAARSAGFEPIKINCVVNESSNEPDARAIRQFAEENGYVARFIPQMQLDSGKFGRIEGGSGGHCERCNRLRLSSDGFLRPCLFNDTKINIRDMSHEEVIRAAIGAKPKRGSESRLNRMGSIGG